MALWLVRSGRQGQQEEFALQHGQTVIDYHALGDLAECDSKDKVKRAIHDAMGEATASKVANLTGQLWAFRGRMEKGDLVVLPLKSRSAIAIGKVAGAYRYRPDNPEGARHTRDVEWIKTDIPRSAFDQDLLYSFGAFMTVCQIKRNNAEERILAVREGRRPKLPKIDDDDDNGAGPETAPIADLEQFARDLIRSRIGQVFKGGGLERLVCAVLDAQGYRTHRAPVGADGGVDILVGGGPMGFDSPRICVQVKSSDSQQDVKVLRELQGVMDGFGAEQGLLVAWGGFKRSVTEEARRLYFKIRLWDADDLVDALLANYAKLPEDIQAELPLKKIWTLVPDED